MAAEIISKRCPKCKQIKSISKFTKCRDRKDGLQCYCKQCQKDARKQSYQNHKIEHRQYGKQYHQTHKAERRQRTKEYHKTISGHLSCLWKAMRQRCNNSKNTAYKYYGGRGIKVKFSSLNDFRDYVMNELKTDPRGLTIDRIDNDGNYERGNIRFVTQSENCKNRRPRSTNIKIAL